MRILTLTLMALLISSCKNEENKSVEKNVFIVSKFNDDNEKRFQETLAKNPELSTIEEIKLYDYPKGAVNFIILKDGSVLYYQEELFDLMCGYGLDKIKPKKRSIINDSLHQIVFSQIYPLLHYKSYEKNMKNDRDMLLPLSFSFENDTIKDFDIYNLLQDIDSLGYHSYTIRRIATFESESISKKKQN